MTTVAEPQEREWISALEAARLLHLSTVAVRRLGSAGLIVTLRLPFTLVKYQRSSILKLIETSTRGQDASK